MEGDYRLQVSKKILFGLLIDFGFGEWLEAVTQK